MIARADAEKLAAEWVAAWNAHDLDAIMHHYADDVEIASPVAAQLLGSDGHVRGKAALRAYFARGLAANPQLRFDLKQIFVGVDTVVLRYANQRGSETAEVMELGADGRVRRMRATYSG